MAVSTTITLKTSTNRPTPRPQFPRTPAGQLMHTLAPTKLYRPVGQMLPAALDTVDAAGHAYPAAQSPLHVDTAKPCVLPNLPAGQSVQLLAADVDEYRPTAHSVHDPAHVIAQSTIPASSTNQLNVRNRFTAAQLKHSAE
jgi:hypothetical protein